MGESVHQYVYLVGQGCQLSRQVCVRVSQAGLPLPASGSGTKPSAHLVYFRGSGKSGGQGSSSFLPGLNN